MAPSGHLNGWVNHQKEPELHKILPNALYLTFNAPQVDEYHRGLYLTYPPSTAIPAHRFAGTLWHASYKTETDADADTNTDTDTNTNIEPPPKWVLESRVVGDLSHSKSLVLLYCLATYHNENMEILAKKIGEVLKSVPLGREARTKQLGEAKGNPVLDGYDCVIWTADALTALQKAGFADFDGRTGEQMMNEIRAIAGPPDARTMVGVDVGGFRVIN